MQVPPEVTKLAHFLVQRYGIVREANSEFYTKALREAVEYRGCYFTFWNSVGMKCLVIYRLDRLPNDVECLPFVQECFSIACGPFGQTQEIGRTERSRHFVEGESLFVTDSIANNMGTALADNADKKDEVEQFDFDETSTAKRMMKGRRNGSS
jgi:hypothetical protein